MRGARPDMQDVALDEGDVDHAPTPRAGPPTRSGAGRGPSPGLSRRRLRRTVAAVLARTAVLAVADRATDRPDPEWLDVTGALDPADRPVRELG